MARGLSIWLLLLFSALYCRVTNEEAVQEAKKNNITVDVNIGVIYDEDSSVGKMGLKCMQMALSDFYNTHGYYKTRIVLQPRLFPKNSVVGAAATALYLLKNAKVKAIIGPTNSMEAEFVIHLGEKAQVPIISYSAASPFLSSTQSSYFNRMSQDQLLQAKPICALIKHFGWREVIPIYVKSDYDSARLIPQLSDALQQIDVRIPYHGAIPSSATVDQIREELHKLKKMQSRVFAVHVLPELASRLFLAVNELGMMGAGYAWILTTGITNALESLDDSVIESMQGAVGLKTYVPITKELKDFKTKWGRKFPELKLNVMGLWAYDSATAIAKAVEQVGTKSTGFQNQKEAISANLTDLDALGVSLVGPKLLQAVLNSSFKGLAGNFRLSSGQLESSTYQIVNVIGSSGRDVGYWTPKKGLERNLNSPASNSSLRNIIWPGDMTLAPRGWGGKKLRVVVPLQGSYKELVNVSYKSNGTPVVTGFCIDIFRTVMEKLKYAGGYEFFPFTKKNGSSAGTYDELVQQVSNQKYDVAVGDISIIASRTSVDFTLPFTESGVTMVVPVKNEKGNAWVFLKPLTCDLWVASLCAFIFIALVIWILEHRINEEFRGPPLHQAGTSLFYSFSMSVFAQRENVLSNLTRFVVIIWVFVVLVLTQSYTASLTSMLTVRKLQPTITNVDELIRKGAHVGFQKGTFVKELLQGKGFDERKLVSYDTVENLDDLLSKGSTNGGIAAVFDEIPYMKLFLARYSSKYVMVQLIYKTDGFGFAFPKGSPLAPEVSRGILNVTEGDDMERMEKAWGLQLSYDSSDPGNTVSSESLGLDSFWGLFLIAGVAASFALLVFIATFLCQHRQVWRDTDASTWSKIRKLVKAFKQRDVSFYTFRKRQVQSRRNIKDDQANIDGFDEVRITQGATGYAPGPSAFSEPDLIEGNLSFSPRSTPPHLCSPNPAPAVPVTEQTSILDAQIAAR